MKGKLIRDLRSAGSLLEGLPPEHKKGDVVLVKKRKVFDDYGYSSPNEFEYHYTDLNGKKLVRSKELLIDV